MKIDWVAEVFSAMRDCGEDISIIFGHADDREGRKEPDWAELPHDHYDGMSGLAKLLRERGFQVDELPALRGDQYSLFRALRGLVTIAPMLNVRRRTWRRFDRERKVSYRPVGERLAWKLFTSGQTEEIRRAAKAAGTTVNTYLLYHLDTAVSAQLTQPLSARRWMIPVNLRGAITRDAESPPHMSFLAVDMANGSSPGQLQTQITGLKARACHWGAWAVLNAGRLIGLEGMRRDLRNREKKNHGWTGIFSNLGVWGVPGAGSWIFCPPVSRVYPVGAGCITMNGRMAVSVQLHEALEGGLPAAYSLLEHWQQGCLGENDQYQSDAA